MTNSRAGSTAPRAGPEAALLPVGDQPLSPIDVAQVARNGKAVALTGAALERIGRGHQIVAAAVARGEPMYGLTTQLGERVTQAVPEDQPHAFALATLRARANSLGPPLPHDTVRAAMLARLSSLATGHSGVSPAAADTLVACLNADVFPRVPSVGSLGASDLCVLAHVGLALCGEGLARIGPASALGDISGWRPAGAVLVEAGITPLSPGPKDGLALCSASSVSAGLAALVAVDAEMLWHQALTATALAFEGFRANLTPLDPRASAARPAPHQAETAAALLRRLRGGALRRPGAGRRLQDPLSLRAAAPILAVVAESLGHLRPHLDAELNGSGDNPAVLDAPEAVMSTGNFQTPGLTLALESLGQAAAQAAASSVSRAACLLTGRLSGLPHILASKVPGSSGFAPLMKVADAVLAELRHRALPVVYESRWRADGVEDEVAQTLLAARKAGEIIDWWRQLVALELMVASEAVERAGVTDVLGAVTRRAYAAVRAETAPLEHDRPLGGELEHVAETLLRRARLPV